VIEVALAVASSVPRLRRLNRPTLLAASALGGRLRANVGRLKRSGADNVRKPMVASEGHRHPELDELVDTLRREDQVDQLQQLGD
jgi:hypothetical protein